jgi:predicted nucleic acid-binding protein
MNASRFAVDSNILVYAADGREPHKQSVALAVIDAGRRLDAWVSTQALGEFYVAATRKLRMPAPAAAAQVKQWTRLFAIARPSASAVLAAVDAAAAGRFSYYDALMLATAEEAGCRAMLSEDMADGASFGGIAVMNPFGRDGVAASVRGLLGLDASPPPG